MQFPEPLRRVVVTGVNGFIGNRVLEYGMDHLPQNVQWVGAQNIEWVGSDLSDTHARATAARVSGRKNYQFFDHEALLEKLESGAIRPDLVIHNGACSSTVETDPLVFKSLNTGYSERLWKVCASLGTPLIYASSASVYGDGALGFDDHPDRTAALRALNLYGQSKLDFDRYALGAKESPPIWFGLRYFNVYGSDESHKGGQASMVFHGFHQIMKTGKVRLFRGNTATGGQYADGCQQRDFVYVADVVRKTWELAASMFGDRRQDLLNNLSRLQAQLQGPRSAPATGAFVNFGTGRARSWNDLAHALFAALGKPPQIEYIDMPKSLQAHYQNFTESKQSVLPVLGLSTDWTSLESGVADYVHSYLSAGKY
jgi:ADP-L-glycero-D-manno-heptose 6-epimerase